MSNCYCKNKCQQSYSYNRTVYVLQICDVKKKAPSTVLHDVPTSPVQIFV